MPKKRLRIIAGAVLLLLVLLAGGIALPVSAAQRQTHSAQDSTPIDANVYLTTSTLQPIFQSRVNDQVPVAMNSTINDVVNKIPTADQGWAATMAKALIQPSANLVSMTPQQNGLATKLRVSLYQGDPKPFDVGLLVKFAIASANSVQVSASALPGSPSLVNGPLTTFQIPFGTLNSIATTPSCGNAALKAGLKFPISLGQNQQQASTGANGLNAYVQNNNQQLSTRINTATPATAYVELPASSLATLGGSIGTLKLDNGLTVKDIQVAVQGNQMVVTSNIMLGFLQLATATTLMQPTAQNGQLAVNVTQTTLSVFIFNFKNNSYNQQIQQMLNTKLNSALAGKLNVTNAAIGTNSQIPCAAADSLILTGTTTLN